jgi:kinesin family protein 2/24
LEEEEELINGHRKHIDDVVDLVKNEMSLLNDVDKPGSDVDSYVK